MSIAIVGGNDGMVKRYLNMCESYRCKAKVFTQQQGIRNQIGSPDLLVIFTGTVSHKMVRTALTANGNGSATVVRSHTSSLSALKKILDDHVRH